MKIVVTQDLLFTPHQVETLEAFGDVKRYVDTPTNEQRLERTKWADIILSEEAGLHEWVIQLNDCYVTFPFTWFLEPVDISILQQNNVVCSAAKWGNKYAVAEWLITALLNLTRKISSIENHSIHISPSNLGEIGMSWLYWLDILILGKGSIGKTVGAMLTSFWANVSYFTRSSWPLIEEVVGRDVILNCLSENKETIGMLAGDIWNNVWNPFVYVTSSNHTIHDVDSIKIALESWIMIWFGDDCRLTPAWDYNDEYYMKASKLIDDTSLLFVNPHIARATTWWIQHSNDVMLENIKAYIEWTPINVVS